MTNPSCGTYAGAQRHRKAGEPIDDACRRAENRYMREWRARNPLKQQMNGKVRQRALELLARKHPDEFTQLRDQVRAQLEGNTTT